MLTWMKKLFAGAATFGATWIGAVWYWRENNRMPDTGDLALYLLVVPLLLLAAFWAGRKVYRGMAAAGVAAAATASAAEPALPAVPPPPPAVALSIVAVAIRAPHGGSAQALLAAVAEGEARPSLDPELEDDAGYPVMTARVQELDEPALRDDLTDWLRKRGTEPGELADEQLRALAAGGAVAAELAGHLAVHPQLEAHAAHVARREPSPLPMLQLHAALTHGWTPPHRAIAGEWLRHLVTAAGWPADRIAAAPEQRDADDIVPILQGLLAAEQPFAIVVACGSHIGPDAIDGMTAAGTLFTSRRQQGQIPGEGAAGLLLAATAQAKLLALDDAPFPALRAVASERRADSADAAKKPDAQPLLAACTRALDQAHCAPDAVKFVAADTDHRTGRVMELMGAVSAALPQLDPAADVAAIGATCGACTPVTFVTTLALGSREALLREAPVLCIGNLDPYRRDVAVIAPASPA